MENRRGTRQRPADKIAVRLFRAGDGPGAAKVMTAAFKTFIPAAHWKTILAGFAPERLEAAGRSGGEGSVTYVATLRGEIVGYVSGTASVYGFGSLSVIGVDPRQLHRGIGTLLMRRMVTFWRRRGMRKVSTCVSAHNARAFQFYLSHGFRPVGYQRDHFMEGVDEVILDRFFTARRAATKG